MQPTLTFADIATARRRLARYLAPTPLAQSFYLGGKDTRYFFKLESLQHAKSFKIRGALNKMLTLTEEEKARGVAAISSGNHGSSVSYAARLLGIRQATIIVPHTTPQSKIDKIRYFGAEVLRMGQSYDEAHVLGMEYIRAARMKGLSGRHILWRHALPNALLPAITIVARAWRVAAINAALPIILSASPPNKVP